MLILTRKSGEVVKIRDNIKITVEQISKWQIEVEVEAPKGVVVCREDVVKKINEKKVLPSAPDA